MDISRSYSAQPPAGRSSCLALAGAKRSDSKANSVFGTLLKEAGGDSPMGADVALPIHLGAEAKAELVRQLADKDSDFYTNMRAALKAQVKKNDEDREEQAIIDAMMAVLDAMSGREPVTGEKAGVNKSASDLTKKIGEKIARLKLENPNDPEIVKLENMLKRFQEMGVYFDLSDTDDLWQDEDATFETLTQLLIRRQAEEIRAEHPTEKEVNEPA